MLELSEGGKTPLTLSNGETRSFLEDGDEVIMTAHAVRDGFRTIGFGECRGRIAG
jgi:fumarylacetoacetase